MGGGEESTKDIDVRGELFDIPSDRPIKHRGLIPLKYFRNVDATPFVYDRFIGACGGFPHHDQVTIYFSNILYAELVLHMMSDYTDTISHYYGREFKHNSECDEAHRNPRLVS